jgi:transmembrane sensor
MSPLRFPLKNALRDPVDEAALHRIAEALQSARPAKTRRRYLAPILVGVVATTMLLLALPRLRHDSGPLRFADGRELATMESDLAMVDLGLSDGSRIRLSPGARVEPLASSGGAFSAIVTRGRAAFEVRPGGPRHWIIECGLATVEVMGTGFTCERGPGRLRVEVHHGVVLVRGDRVPDRARRLVAGERLDLIEDPPLAAPVVADHHAPLVPIAPGGPVPTVRAGAPSWKNLARRGQHDEAFNALGTDGLRRETKRLGVADLLALADVARLSGHPAEAVRPLERILDQFAQDPQAPLAAFALGRLELDTLGHARAAAAAFTKAIALGIPHGLREDTRARLVEALARSGDAAGANRAAEAYRQEFPEGRHLRAIEGWLRQK